MNENRHYVSKEDIERIAGMKFQHATDEEMEEFDRKMMKKLNLTAEEYYDFIHTQHSDEFLEELDKKLAAEEDKLLTENKQY